MEPGADPVSMLRRRGGRAGIMDVSKILVELKDERRQIEEAILSLERLARGRGRRRGRPPAWLAEAVAPKRRGTIASRSRNSRFRCICSRKVY